MEPFHKVAVLSFMDMFWIKRRDHFWSVTFQADHLVRLVSVPGFLLVRVSPHSSEQIRTTSVAKQIVFPEKPPVMIFPVLEKMSQSSAETAASAASAQAHC